VRHLLRLAVIVGCAGLLIAGIVRGFTVPLRAVTKNAWSSAPLQLSDLGQLDQPSTVYDRFGKILTTFHQEIDRKPVTLDQVPAVVRNAVLDIEDKSFYHHGGIDARGIARAFLANGSAGGVRQGGSTITQQLVKQSLVGPERSIDRKIKEAVLAERIEQKMTKDQILERYLNLVYFGHGAYGVEAAAETYFGVPVGQLQPVQAALLAGLIRNPTGYDPVLHPVQAATRRNTVLDVMAQSGHLAPDEAAALKVAPVPTTVQAASAIRQSYFIEELRQTLLDDPRLGSTATERANAVYRGGLQIHSTFDPAMQGDAEKAAAIGNILPKNALGAVDALVSVEPATGAVRAIVGGPGFDQYQYDIATHSPGRQPGSSFKLFTLLAALESGYGPQSPVDGTGPCLVVTPGTQPTRAKPPVPINNAEPGSGTMTMASATAGSVNCAFERMAATVGINKVVDVAKRLLHRTYSPLPAVVIGAQEATPLEMASAYATLANDGVEHAPTYVTDVLDRSGHLLYSGVDAGQRVLTTQVSRTAVGVLEGVLQGGTAACCPLAGGRPAAGKTGTTNGFTNAWFVGFTPQLASAVWVGVPTGQVSMSNVGGREVFGATYSAPIWKQYMDAALASQPNAAFPAPSAKGAIGSQPFVLPKGSWVLGTAAPTGLTGLAGSTGLSGANARSSSAGTRNGSGSVTLPSGRTTPSTFSVPTVVVTRPPSTRPPAGGGGGGTPTCFTPPGGWPGGKPPPGVC
jgi:penicillin-binding protein 1A